MFRKNSMRSVPSQVRQVDCEKGGGNIYYMDYFMNIFYLIDNQLSAENQNPEKKDELDQEILNLLGENTEISVLGPELQPQLAEKWSNILRVGLEKTAKQTLMKEYTIPSN